MSDIDDALQAHLRNEIRMLRDLLAEREAEIETLLELVDETSAGGTKHNRAVGPETTMLVQFRVWLSSKLHRIVHHSKYASLERSPLFDTQWYARAYSDCGGPEGACAHYLRQGAFDGNDPGPDFDTNGYYAANPDVRAAGWPALAHYLLHGKREGRHIGQREGDRRHDP